MSVISISIVGTFAIIYIINTLRTILIILQKLEKNNLSFFASISSVKP